ncbi:MAG: DEAD/DEAH box helicase family protein [Verrucomicrobiota bacterium]
MKLKFKHQTYQADAVKAVVDCFQGQPRSSGLKYAVDPGATSQKFFVPLPGTELEGFANASLVVSPATILNNLQLIQREYMIPVSPALVVTPVSKLNLDIEMETGTGKTYCYIKTMFELNKRYGWSKFIVVVPSIAIREGVSKSFEVMAEHFLEQYGKRARPFIYNSKQLHHLESFSSDAGINVMIINQQAFATKGEDARRIYGTPITRPDGGIEMVGLDDFQSRKPIDIIRKNRPILILDEPQKLEGKTTLEKLKEFDPLMILRYSATHKTEHNKVYRLDALDAYNQKLVKKIAVRGISVKGLAGTNAYLYLESIRTSPKKPPEAVIEFEVMQGAGIKRVRRVLRKGDDLYSLSGNLEQYRDGYVVSEINANDDTVGFIKGLLLRAGEAVGDVNESSLRRIQIREAIKAHFEKEQRLFAKGIKVLSLFFIDEVAKYRQYTADGEFRGEYATIFEEEYTERVNEVLTMDDTSYNRYLKGIPASRTHNGYFSQDKKTRRFIDSKASARGENVGEADDVDAYDLILKEKERLLSFEEPVRFIFSHSALREGWDNPNVFVICTLKHSDNTVSRRQEVGRGMRLAVNAEGDRVDDPAIVHDVNVLTVVASESYKDFVAGLQTEISKSISSRPREANAEYFIGKILKSTDGDVTVSPKMAKQIEFYLIQNGYVDFDHHITEMYHAAKQDGTLVSLPAEIAPFKEGVFELIDSVFSDAQLPQPDDELRTKENPLNANFEKKEFQDLWRKINHKAIYTVHFDSEELITKSIKAIDDELKISPLQYVVTGGEQKDETSYEELKKGEGFVVRETATEKLSASAHSSVMYDLIGKVAEATILTRCTVSRILCGINVAVFGQYKRNPEDFIFKVARLINEQKATVIVSHLEYDTTTGIHEIPEIFTQRKADLSKGFKAKNHIYDYVFTDSTIERNFVGELDASAEVVVYAKLPKTFFIPTPVGNYNPDWAIAFNQNEVKHVYFIAETKGDLSSMQLRDIEKSKIACARKFFAKITSEQVRYDVVDSYGTLMELVK